MSDYKTKVWTWCAVVWGCLTFWGIGLYVVLS